MPVRDKGRADSDSFFIILQALRLLFTPVHPEFNRQRHKSLNSNECFVQIDAWRGLTSLGHRHNQENMRRLNRIGLSYADSR